MRLKLLSLWLDITLALYLRAYAAYSAALPRRAGDGEKTVKAVNEDWRTRMLQ